MSDVAQSAFRVPCPRVRDSFKRNLQYDIHGVLLPSWHKDCVTVAAQEAQPNTYCGLPARRSEIEEKFSGVFRRFQRLMFLSFFCSHGHPDFNEKLFLWRVLDNSTHVLHRCQGEKIVRSDHQLTGSTCFQRMCLWTALLLVPRGHRLRRIPCSCGPGCSPTMASIAPTTSLLIAS